MNKSTSVLIAFAAGAVAGLVAGILLAPDKGSETRKKMTDAGKKFADGLTEKFSEVTGKYRKDFANGEES